MFKQSKRFFNYYLNKHKENSLNSSLNSIKQLNLTYNSDYQLPITSEYNHIDNFSFRKSFAQNFTNEVLACVVNESLIKESNEISKEAKELATYYTKDIKIGAYSESNGIAKIRENFKVKLEKQGIFDLSIKDMLFTNGSVNAFEHILSTLCEKNDQVLVPNPFYPLILNLIRSRGINNLEYRLTDEDSKIDINLLKTVYESNKKLYPIKAIIISHPHEPTGKIHSKLEIQEVIKFCYENKVSLVSWEVGASSITNEEQERKYTPVMKILQEMPEKIRNGTTLFTCYGLTRGVPNMSSLRAGLVVVKNLDPFVHSQLTKYKSIDLCSSIISQIGFDIIHSQDFSALFGSKFNEKYNSSIKQEKDVIRNLKKEIIKKNLNEKVTFPKKIDSGVNLFTKLNYLDSKTFIKKYYNEVDIGGVKDGLITPGSLYGSNRENYVNILIKNKVDYDKIFNIL
jgi:aspartate/methionine/tyrosine aminotransferase